jgi:hypothetical protein
MFFRVSFSRFRRVALLNDRLAPLPPSESNGVAERIPKRSRDGSFFSFLAKFFFF